MGVGDKTAGVKEFGIKWRSFSEEDDLARGVRMLNGRFSHLVGISVVHLSRGVSADDRSTRCGIGLSSIRDAKKMETTPWELGGLFGAAGSALGVNGMTVCLTMCTRVGGKELVDEVASGIGETPAVVFGRVGGLGVMYSTNAVAHRELYDMPEGAEYSLPSDLRDKLAYSDRVDQLVDGMVALRKVGLERTVEDFLDAGAERVRAVALPREEYFRALLNGFAERGGVVVAALKGVATGLEGRVEPDLRRASCALGEVAGTLERALDAQGSAATKAGELLAILQAAPVEPPARGALRIEAEEASEGLDSLR